MAITRADTLISVAKKQELFSDFLDSFAMSPFSGQLSLVKNERSVSQSVKNLILTDFGERLFNPNFGSNISRTLFEPNFEDSLSLLEDRIRLSIENFEPRAIIIDVIVKSTQKTDFSIIDTTEYAGLFQSKEYNDALKKSQEQKTDLTGYTMPGDNEYSVEVTVVFKTINNTNPVTLTVLLKRVR